MNIWNLYEHIFVVEIVTNHSYSSLDIFFIIFNHKSLMKVLKKFLYKSSQFVSERNPVHKVCFIDHLLLLTN